MIKSFQPALLFFLLSTDVCAEAQQDITYRERVIRFLLDHPDVIVEALERFSILEQERLFNERLEKFPELFSAPTPLGLGSKDAPHRIIEFFDYRCAPCKAIHPELKAITDRNPNVRIEMRHLPILSHGSELAARFALAVRFTKNEVIYQKAHNLLWSHRGPYNTVVLAKLADKLNIDFHTLEPVMRSEKVTHTIDRNRDIASAFEISGTPAFITPYSVSVGRLDIDAISKGWLSQ